MASIRFTELKAAEDPPPSAGSAAPALTEPSVRLRFRVASTDARGLEALRYARRAMLREEWTRGVEDGEPSLEDAVFSAFEVSWSVPASAAPSCRAKLADLVSRANRALDETPAESTATGRTAARRA